MTFHAIPPSNGGWYKIVQTDLHIRGAETMALLSPELPDVAELVKKIVDKLNRGKE
jgi:hypothetical protein